MEEPLAPAIRRWSPGTVERWTAILRDVGRFATHWPELDAAGALSQYLVRRAAMGQQPGTLRGAISALRLAEKLGCIRPTVRPVHWLMARGAATTTAAPRPTQVWAELVTLRLMARSIRTTLDWFCLGLAVISFATLLRVGEAASVRPVDLRKRCVLGFFDDKKDDDWVTVRLGAWPDAWRAAMAAHPWVSSRPASVPLMAAAFDLQAAIHGLLAATGWESMGWHAWRRGGAAAMRAFGAAIASIAVAGRWDNEAEAHRYASAPPGWEFFLPDDVPWPTPGFGVEIRPVHAYQLWALGTLGPHPMSALGTMAAKGPACVAIPTCRRPSYWAPLVTSRLTRWHAGPPGTPAKASARPTCTEPWPAAGRHPQRGQRGLSPPRSPEPSRPQMERPAAEPQPPVPRLCPGSRRQGQAPEAPRHLGGRRRDGAAERLGMQLAVARCARCGLDWNDHLEAAARHMGRSLRAPADNVLSLLQAWWAESIKWAVDRPAWKERAAAADLALAEEALHLLAGGEIPLDGGSSTRLNDQSRVTVELAARGLGDTGRVHVPPHVWKDWADPEFGRAGGRVHPLPPSRCPRVAALLSTLASQGLVSVVGGGVRMRRCSSSGNHCEHEDVQPGVQVQGPPLQAAVAGGPILLRDLGGRVGGAEGGGLWGTKLDIANCYWSVELPPPPLANTIRVAAQGHTHAFLRVPFGWHRAPGLVQALISDLLRDLGKGGGVVVQYLDDVLFVGHDPGEVATVTDSAARLLRQAGFLISEKSVFTPQRSLQWMGKDVDLAGCRVAPAASTVAAVVAAWVKLALRPYTYVALRRLLGKIGWLGRPGNLGGCFLAGARSWLRWGPRWARRTPAAVVRGLCEAIAQCYRGWEPDTTGGGPAVRVFVDAAMCALTTGTDPSYCVGSWGPGGADLSLCPAWVTTQQAAELWGTLVALDDAQARRARRLVLVGDNMGALAQLLSGRAGAGKVQQQRILRRIAHRLRWTGLQLTLCWVQPALNPADSISRAWDGRGGRAAVIEAAAKERLWVSSPQWAAWGAIADRDKAVRPCTVPLPVWMGG